jgi:arylsulfatase
VAYTDHEIGRVIQAVEDLGKLDNTLIIYIEGDNGTSAEGTMVGTPNEMASLQGVTFPVEDQLKFYDVWGSDKTYPHMAVPWSWAFDTPFKWMKQVASHFGGTKQGMAIALPNRIKDAGGLHTQFHHMIDIVPTILEAASIQAPAIVNGIAQRPIEGVSMAYTFDKENTDVPSKRQTQYFEIFGNRAIYHNGWIAATTPPAGPWEMGLAKMPTDVVNGYKWELYNIAEDYSEYNDLAAKMPDKLHKLQELFLVEGQKYNVFPLDDSVVQRALVPRPSTVADRNVFTYSGEVSGIPTGNAPSILNRSYTITAEVDIPEGGGGGMIVTEGGRFGGYGLYFLKGKPMFLYNLLDLARFRWDSQETLAPGKHTIVFDFTYDGPGFGKGGTGVLKVDGKEVANNKIPNTIPFIMPFDETFDIGLDTRTPVDDNDYQVPFQFTGKIVKLTFNLEPEQLSEADRKVMHQYVIRGTRPATN